MVINIHGIDIEIICHECWYDDKIIFYSDPEERKKEIIEYLYREGFIRDRRTPYIIKELT